MASYSSFNEYVSEKDQLNEAWPKWLSKMTNWSPAPDDVNQARSGGWPIKDVGQQPQPKVAARDLGNMAQAQPSARRSATLNLTPDQKAQGRAAYQQATQQPQRVKFSAQDVMEIKREIGEYAGMFKSFLRKMERYLGSSAVRDYEQNVKPYYDELKTWRGYIDQMLASLPRRESVEEMDDLVTEAVRVSHKDFARMLGSIKNLTAAAQQWLERISAKAAKNPEFVEWAKNLFNTTIGNAQRRIDTVGQWIKQKLQALMANHGREYQEPTKGGVAPQFRPIQ